ncbi:Epithelial splicing regulatory protein [Apis cerana cerana]|uniref:Epithelial splicing regulatory protein n=2 Tax=Apis cerana TaxID=7461 RepID=A0A2A3EP36_APICC|nr:Epithelial splicing regulatory protein [Apis cerana cerana]
MPLSATYNDVRHAFQGIYIRKDGLKLINDNHGNRVGIAYVKFSKAEGKELALSTTRFVRGSEVEVLHLDESIFDKAVDSYSPEKERDRGEDGIDDVRSSACILLTDLPSFTKEMDIAKLFHDWKINDLFITSSKESGTIQCMAYVQFARIEDAKASVNTSLKIGNKPVTATAITEEKFAQAKRDHEQNSMNQTASSDCVIMRGLPFQTIDRDILDFFSDIGIVPHRIHMLHQNGKPAGECFCEFDTADEALRATAKNGLPFGKNVPTIELVPRAKMLETLGMVDPQIMETQQQHFPPLQEQRPRFSGPMNHLPRFGNSGFGPRCPPGLMGIPRHMLGRHPGSMDYVVEGFGKPGCVLSLENVPFKADINEIIEFFGDFDVKRENVIRRYNERGMPTGDARVAFASPSEAQRALRELKHCKMRDRTIYMKLA